MSARPAPKPWPMRWIVLAILLTLVPYTWISLHYRKQARPFEPYNDLKQRANVHRLLAAGFNRIPLSADRPADAPLASPAAQASPMPAPAGIPAVLKDALVDVPNLPDAILSAKAAASASTLLPYVMELECSLSNLNLGLASSYLYLKGSDLCILTDFETFAGDLRSRSRNLALRLTAPAGSIPAGEYRVIASGARESVQWRLTVK